MITAVDPSILISTLHPALTPSTARGRDEDTTVGGGEVTRQVGSIDIISIEIITTFIFFGDNASEPEIRLG